METMAVSHNGAHRDVLDVTHTMGPTLTLIRTGMYNNAHTIGILNKR